MSYPVLKFQKLSENAFPPKRGTKLSSGLDVFSPDDYVIHPRQDILIPLDLRFEIPEGWDLCVYNKSGFTTRNKTDKGADLIDCDYRGNCHVHLYNLGSDYVYIKKGDKIAQLVMREVWLGELVESNDISTNTERGSGGFGSTGDRY